MARLDVRELLQQAAKIAGSKRKLAKVLGVSYTAIHMWGKGFMPNDRNRRKLEKLINEGIESFTFSKEMTKYRNKLEQDIYYSQE